MIQPVLGLGFKVCCGPPIAHTALARKQTTNLKRHMRVSSSNQRPQLLGLVLCISARSIAREGVQHALPSPLYFFTSTRVRLANTTHDMTRAEMLPPPCIALALSFSLRTPMSLCSCLLFTHSPIAFPPMNVSTAAGDRSFNHQIQSFVSVTNAPARSSKQNTHTHKQTHTYTAKLPSLYQNTPSIPRPQKRHRSPLPFPLSPLLSPYLDQQLR
jgi:hypothetical protein